jgi:hypothetical protein
MDDHRWTRGWLASVGALSVLMGCHGGPQATPQATAPQPGPTVSAPPNSHLKREEIFFIKGDSTLSPGAIEKLQRCATAWDAGGTWVLAFPSDSGVLFDVLERRLLALRVQLRKFGVQKLETRLLPQEPEGKYDVIYIEKNVP